MTDPLNKIPLDALKKLRTDLASVSSDDTENVTLDRLNTNGRGEIELRANKKDLIAALDAAILRQQGVTK